MYREHFQCLDQDGLLGFLRGTLRLRRPGIVISFDDGLRDNATVAAPLLEESALRGWFMVPGAFLDEPEANQPRFFRHHVRATPNAEHPADTPARAMSWANARELAGRGHVLGCHTWSHRPLGPGTPAETIAREVVDARQRLEDRLGREVRTFAWARGRVGDYSAPAHRAVARNYDLALSSLGQAVRPNADPHAVHRFNVEASFAMSVVRFQVSRLNELAFAARRSAVMRALAGESD
ncbi:MAG: polysaccharide deacetylase family protein [Polyangiaceae bacterium]